MTTEQDAMLNTASKLEQNGETGTASKIHPEGGIQKYLRLIPTSLGETAIFAETKNRWK
jgi:hypothetical protein